jgi:hypothetical protein
MDDKKPHAMTAFAQAALAASDLIRTKFQQTRLGGSVPRVVRIEAPQMESTGGGRQARESIVLSPEGGDAGQAITAGFIDVGLRSAEVRSFTAIAMLYQQRHKARLDLPEAEYNQFVSELQALLQAEGYVFKLVDAHEQAQKAVQQPEPAAQKSALPMAAIGVVLALIVVGLAIAFLK